MIIGYVFSREDDKEFPIVKDVPITKDMESVESTKLYSLLKKYIFYKNLPF